MNIAASSASPQQTPARTDAATAPTRVALGPDSDSVDTPVETDANAAQGFGSVLARQIDKGGANDLPPDDPAKKIDDTVDPSGTPFATTAAGDPRNADPVVTTSGFGVAVSDDVDAKSAIARSTASKNTSGLDIYGTPDDATRQQKTDAAGDDLAAQIALVSQWAAVTVPVATSSASASGSDDGLDIKGKLDSIRGATVKGDGATAAANAAAQDPALVAEAGAVAVPLVATTVLPSATGRTSTKDASSAAAITGAAEAKVPSDATATAAGQKLSIADALLGKLDAAATPGTSDAASFTNAFVTQLTAQVSNAQASITTPTPTQATGTLHEQVGTPAWSHEVGQAALKLAASDLQGASLRLNPEHLGPLDVQVRIDNGTAHLAFHAVHADTRQAIEASRTTLDQLFAQQGLKIGDVAVGDASRRGFDADASQGSTSQRDGSGSGSRWGGKEAAADTGAQTVTTRVSRALGLVDTFA